MFSDLRWILKKLFNLAGEAKPAIVVTILAPNFDLIEKKLIEHVYVYIEIFKQLKIKFYKDYYLHNKHSYVRPTIDSKIIKLPHLADSEFITKGMNLSDRTIDI